VLDSVVKCTELARVLGTESGTVLRKVLHRVLDPVFGAV